MTPVDCAREHEVVSALLAGRRLEADSDLSAHAAQCGTCSEVVTIAGLLREDRDAALLDAHVPAAGQVWWRAAIRARLEAAQAAARPITWIHGLMGASAVGLTTAAADLVWPSLRHVSEWVGARIATFDPDGAALAALLGDSVLRTLPVAIAIAAALVLAPIALYFALSDD